MKSMIMFFLLSATLISFGQNASPSFLEVRKHHDSYAINPNNDRLYLNKAEKTLEIAGVNIPLTKVQILYKEIQGHHLVSFNCQDGCITGIDEKPLASSRC